MEIGQIGSVLSQLFWTSQDLQELLLHVAPFAGYSTGKEYFEHENPVGDPTCGEREGGSSYVLSWDDVSRSLATVVFHGFPRKCLKWVCIHLTSQNSFCVLGHIQGYTTLGCRDYSSPWSIMGIPISQQVLNFRGKVWYVEWIDSPEKVLFAPQVRTPCLIINAMDDPLTVPTSLGLPTVSTLDGLKELVFISSCFCHSCSRSCQFFTAMKTGKRQTSWKRSWNHHDFVADSIDDPENWLVFYECLPRNAFGKMPGGSDQGFWSAWGLFLGTSLRPPIPFVSESLMVLGYATPKNSQDESGYLGVSFIPSKLLTFWRLWEIYNV